MAIDLQNAQNIATGWKPPVEFTAPNISGVLGDILRQRQFQQELQQKQIADAVKAIQEQRQQNAYASALREAGLTGGQDISGVGSDEATALSRQIMAQKVADARAGEINAHTAYYNAKAANPYAPSRGGGGGGSGGGGDGSTEPATKWDDQGREWRPGPGGRWILISPRGGGTGSDANVAKDVKERLGLIETKTEYEKEIAKERAANMAANKPDVPYSHSDEYNLTVNRLKQLQARPGMPSTDPAVPQRPPAETGDTIQTSKVQPTTGGADKNLAPGFGNPVSDQDVEALGWARAHPDDPRSAAILRKLGIE